MNHTERDFVRHCIISQIEAAGNSLSVATIDGFLTDNDLKQIQAAAARNFGMSVKALREMADAFRRETERLRALLRERRAGQKGD